MRKINMYIDIVLTVLLVVSCGPGAGQDHPSSPAVKAKDSYQQGVVCGFEDSQVGNAVSTSGEITFLTEDDPNGIFAEMSDDGCTVGIFAPTEIWESWSVVQMDAMRTGNQVMVWGKLVSFEGQLIIDLADIVEAQQDAEDGSAQEDQTEVAVLDLPEALPNVMLDVPLVYSGSNNLPGLCYLGSAGMLVRYAHPEADFSDVVALSGVGSSALHLNFPEMPSMLVSQYLDQSIVFLSNNLGAPFALGFQSSGAGSDSFQPAGLPFEKNASYLLQFADQAEAAETLKQVLSAGYPVMVYLNMYLVHDDFSDDSTFWRDVLGKDRASHYMVVKGYDAETVYLNDPTDPTDAAGDMSANWDNFLDAWEDTTSIPNAPPLGPFWSLFLTEKGAILPAVDVIALNLEKAIEAPDEIRSFADAPDDDPFTRFLLLELANARIHYGEYLTRNNYTEAGALYTQSGTLMETMAVEGAVNADALLRTANLEEQALQILME